MRKKFGQMVREKRIEKKLSQEQLSYSAGVYRTYVGSVERGEKNLTIDSMEKIADGLHHNLIISLIKK